MFRDMKIYEVPKLCMNKYALLQFFLALELKQIRHSTTHPPLLYLCLPFLLYTIWAFVFVGILQQTLQCLSLLTSKSHCQKYNVNYRIYSYRDYQTRLSLPKIDIELERSKIQEEMIMVFTFFFVPSKIFTEV